MKVRCYVAGLAVGLLLAGTIHNAGAQQALKVQRQKFANGLTVLALEDHALPSVAYYTVFKVGSRNERPGITGLSHLFEHMMFNGSARFAPKQFDQILEGGGGDSNATTDADTTEYYEQFSSGTLDIVLQMEADRMRALKLDKANIEQERGIVKEERRVNTDNNVESALSEVLWNSAFVAHPYHWDTIGFMKDIDAIRLSDAKEYFRLHYAPNNAVVAVVGDFDTRALFAKMTKYYGDIKPQPPAPPVVNSEPPQMGERRIAFHKAAELPVVQIGYHIGAQRDPNDPALDTLSFILSHGESSRLYRRLVYEKQIAASVSASNEAREDPGLFTFAAQAQPGHTAQECENEIYDVLTGVQKDGVTPGEMLKAKNAERVGFLDAFKTNLGRARLLTEYEAQWGGWQKLYDYLPRHDRVTASDVQRVSKQYFSDRNRTVVTLIPDKAPDQANSTPSGSAPTSSAQSTPAQKEIN